MFQDSVQEFINNITSEISVVDAIDILIVAFVVYKILGFIVKTRAVQILKGVLVLVLALVVSDALNLYTLNWMCKGAVAMGAVAILVVFQPELRRALEYMGRGSFMRPTILQEDKERVKRNVNQIVHAIDDFSANHVGALIVFEGQALLEDVVETGTVLDAAISEQLLGNIFYEGSPLHDGAVIIREGKIHAAGCVLPLTREQEIGKNLGTRHRAGLGVTEYSDAMVLIVSEETGIISMAKDGRMDRYLDTRSVEKILLDHFLKNRDLSERIEKVPWARKFIDRIKPRPDRARDRDKVDGQAYGTWDGRNTTSEIPPEELQEAARRFSDETRDLKDLNNLRDLEALQGRKAEEEQASPSAGPGVPTGAGAVENEAGDEAIRDLEELMRDPRLGSERAKAGGDLESMIEGLPEAGKGEGGRHA